VSTDRDPARRSELRYAVGASMLLWYAPLIAALFVGPVARSDNARAAWLTYFAVLPGMLAKSIVASGDPAVHLAVAGAATLFLLGGVAILWFRWRRRRASLAVVTLAFAVTNAYVLSGLFAL